MWPPLLICYQADLEKGFHHRANATCNGEPLEEYLKPVGGGYFFTLPGCQRATRISSAARCSTPHIPENNNLT